MMDMDGDIMFNKAKSEWKKTLKSQEKEKNSKSYNGWDIGKIGTYDVTKDGVLYHMNRPAKLVVDNYDDYNGSIESSHHESIGYAIVEGYEGNTETLDFSFIRPQDAIRINCGEEIKTVIINASNLRDAILKSEHPLQIVIVVDTNKIDTLIGVKTFVKNHGGMVKGIKYVDSNKSLSGDVSETLGDVEQENTKGKSK